MSRSRIVVGVLSLVLLLASQLVVVVDPADRPPAPEVPPVVEPVDPSPPPAPIIKPTLCLYCHEKDDGAVPSGVSAALDEINRKHGVRANVFENDTTNGDGEIPEQYRGAVKAAREAGLPCLVVMGGDVVLKIMRAPKTKEEVLSEYSRLASAG